MKKTLNGGDHGRPHKCHVAIVYVGAIDFKPNSPIRIKKNVRCSGVRYKNKIVRKEFPCTKTNSKVRNQFEKPKNTQYRMRSDL